MIIKTCGLRKPSNIQEISQLAVDWLGFIFYPKSTRYMADDAALLDYLQSEKAQQGAQKRVGVFVNETHEALLKAIDTYELDYVQLHGAEGPMYCEAILKYLAQIDKKEVQLIKAFRVSESFDFNITLDYEDYCAYYIFDTKGQLPGGNGKQFNWEILERYQGKTPFILSGGIGPDDAAAVQALKHPKLAGIDVNSKFETAPALKNIETLAAFVSELRK